jgi:curved DNA-binding protein CbpA
MDDYYELLGVDEDAPVDDIRSAYRDKKAAVDTSAGDDAKSDVAKLNKAWNVLSDPYQRGRYDQQRNTASDDNEYDDDEYEDDEEEAAPVARSRSRAAERAETRRNARQPAKPTVTLPAGVHFPTTKQRLVAMSIDLGVLLGIFLFTSFVVAPAVDRAVHGPIVDRIDVLQKQFDQAKKESERLDNIESAVAKSKGENSTEAKQAKRASTNYDDHQLKDATKRLDDETAKLIPLNFAVTGGGLLLGLLYLVIPSARTGQTFGKRRQGVRVIMLDGSPPGLAGSIRRYGLLLFTTFLLLLTPLGPLGAVLVLFASTRWTNNPNQQGLHDRISKTLVVADDAA